MTDTDELEFDGDDVYAADEVACPRCGQTVRVGDTLRFHWRAHRHVGRPMAVSVNGGPWVSYVMDDEDTENGEDRQP
jgi:hypothetical protein